MIITAFYTDVQYLIMLIIGHICADFMLQTGKMEKEKTFLSLQMLYHIIIVFISSAILSLSWEIPLVLTILHYFTDSLLYSANKKWNTHPFRIFIVGQVIHFITLLLVWSIYFKKVNFNLDYIESLLKNTNYLIVILGYIIIIWPAARLVKFGVEYLNVKSGTPSGNQSNENAYRGGQYIGQFERIIIMTFVLLGEYEAIGFLITGKSIIRFKESDKLQTEYVLFGTMMSYALAIVTGLFVKMQIH